MAITNKKELRWRYEQLSIYNDPKFRALAVYPERLDERIKEIKREIRAYNNKPIPERRVITSDFQSCVVLTPCPAWVQSFDDAEEWFSECEEMECRPSQYDCTGQLFTTGYTFAVRGGRFWCYHSIGMDV